jgi:hypothetical protein
VLILFSLQTIRKVEVNMSKLGIFDNLKKSQISLVLALVTAQSLSLTLIPGAFAAPTPAKTKEASVKATDKKSDKPENKGAKVNDKGADKAGEKAEKPPAKPAPEIVIENVVDVQPERLVDQPNAYLNKNVRFTANFFTYSSLALDYKPIMRSAKTHLSFLVLRNNSKVPLSELKLAMVIPKDEKGTDAKLLLELKEGDQVEITGKVAGVALDEPWVDVLKLKRLKAANEEKKAENGSGATGSSK